MSFLLNLGTVILGVLIARWLEGVGRLAVDVVEEWWEERIRIVDKALASRDDDPARGHW